MDQPVGLETLIETLSRDKQAPEAMRAVRQADAVGEESMLEAPLPSGAPSSTPISATAIDLIVASEVSSRAHYEKRFLHPIWPKGNSGVTIGIGYDVGTVNAAAVRADWTAQLGEAAVGRLVVACGVTGPAAFGLLPQLADIAVGWDAASAVFLHRSVPVFVGITERALPNTSLLGPDCLGALVSLVYNRGASFGRPEDRFREMRAIRDHMADRAFQLIPGELRAMKRIWQGDPNMAGLLVRREAEAQLFERDLAHLPTAGRVPP